MPKMQDFTAYHNGEWKPWSDVKIDPLDLGFVLGDTVFETLRTFNGKPLIWKEHVERIYRSLKYTRMNCGLNPEEMYSMLVEGINKNKNLLKECGDFNIWLQISRGTSMDGPPTIFAQYKPVPFDTFTDWYRDGAHVVFAKTKSHSFQTIDPKIKHSSRMNFVLAQLETKDIDPNALTALTDLDGHVTEGTSFNIMTVKDGVIKTPTDSNILQGVSRDVVIRLAKNLSLEILEENIQPYDLVTADEVFLSRTTPGIVPVSKVDNVDIEGEIPGPITQKLLAAYGELVGFDLMDQAFSYENVEHEDLISTLNHRHKKK